MKAGRIRRKEVKDESQSVSQKDLQQLPGYPARRDSQDYLQECPSQAAPRMTGEWVAVQDLSFESQPATNERIIQV